MACSSWSSSNSSSAHPSCLTTALKQLTTALKQLMTALKELTTALKQLTTTLKQLTTALKQLTTALKQLTTALKYYKPGRTQNKRGSHPCAATRGRRCHATTHQDAPHQRGLHPAPHMLNLVPVLHPRTHQGNASQPLHQCVAFRSVVGCCRC